MPKAEDHIKQVQSNIDFLAKITQTAPDNADWHVTVAFYSALHLVNAHLAEHGLQQRSHYETLNLINPFNLTVPIQMQLSPDAFDAYRALQSLSRRARYLVNEKDDQLNTENAAWSFYRHSEKAFRHLDTLLVFFKTAKGIDLPIVELRHPTLSLNKLTYIKIYR